MKALIMGSFDPITLGHQYLINQALARVEDLTVCVMVNENKRAAFSLEQRLAMLNLISCNNFKIDCYSGWCYEYCLNNDIELIIRGFRNSADYAYETEMAVFNKSKCGVNTELIYTDGTIATISSSDVKKRIESGQATDDYLDARIVAYIKKLSSENR